MPAKVNGVAPGFTLRFSAWCAKPPVPKVAIHALNGHYCLISNLSAVNSNPRPGLSSQDQSHKDVCPHTGLWHALSCMYVFILEPSWELSTSLRPRLYMAHVAPDHDVMLVPCHGILKQDTKGGIQTGGLRGLKQANVFHYLRYKGSQILKYLQPQPPLWVVNNLFPFKRHLLERESTVCFLLGPLTHSKAESTIPWKDRWKAGLLHTSGWSEWNQKSGEVQVYHKREGRGKGHYVSCLLAAVVSLQLFFCFEGQCQPSRKLMKTIIQQSCQHGKKRKTTP